MITMMAVAGVLQLLGGIVLSIGYLPQIRKSYKTKSVDDFDAIYYPSIFIGLVMYQVYALTLVVQTGSGGMYLITNTFSLVLAGIMVYYSVRYRGVNKKK